MGLRREHKKGAHRHTRLNTVGIEFLELLGDGLHLLCRTARDSPFQIGRVVLHDMLGTEMTGIAGGTQEDKVILRVGRHVGEDRYVADVALLYGEARRITSFSAQQ